MTVRILTGDCRDVLSTLAEASVHCCVTSPPYWGLRCYNIPPSVWGGDPACQHVWGDDVTKIGGGKQPADKVRWQHDTEARPNGHQAAAAGAFCRCGAWRGAHGLEPTIDLYVRNAVEVFRAVRRVLRPDGVLFLNLGDSYATRWSSQRREGRGGLAPNGRERHGPPPDGLKNKDLCGIPWRIAFALQADGWWLRQDIIWAKPNPMPESVTDRCTKAHEYLFLLTKSARYFYDAEAIKEAAESIPQRRLTATADQPKGRARTEADVQNPLCQGGTSTERNKRSVWTVATSPFPEAHFATFPPELIIDCIKAGTSEKGCCAKCGAPWERIVERPAAKTIVPSAGQKSVGYIASGMMSATPRRSSFHGPGWRDAEPDSVTTLGWRPSCKCGSWVADKEWNSEPTIPCTVLDPFGGAGTTGLVADRLQRNAILIELNAAYSNMAYERIRKEAGLFSTVEISDGDEGLPSTPPLNGMTCTTSSDSSSHEILSSDGDRYDAR